MTLSNPDHAFGLISILFYLLAFVHGRYCRADALAKRFKKQLAEVQEEKIALMRHLGITPLDELEDRNLKAHEAHERNLEEVSRPSFP